VADDPRPMMKPLVHSMFCVMALSQSAESSVCNCGLYIIQGHTSEFELKGFIL